MPLAPLLASRGSESVAARTRFDNGRTQVLLQSLGVAPAVFDKALVSRWVRGILARESEFRADEPAAGCSAPFAACKPIRCSLYKDDGHGGDAFNRTDG